VLEERDRERDGERDRERDRGMKETINLPSFTNMGKGVTDIQTKALMHPDQIHPSPE